MLPDHGPAGSGGGGQDKLVKRQSQAAPDGSSLVQRPGQEVVINDGTLFQNNFKVLNKDFRKRMSMIKMMQNFDHLGKSVEES